MIETAWQSEEIAHMAYKVIENRPDLRWIPAAGISIGFLESDRRKKKNGRDCLAECIKVKDLYKVYIPHDFLIVVYKPNVSGLSGHQMEILLYHELLHLGMDDTGEEVRYIVNPHDVEDFRAVIDRYGIDWAKT
ncbi:MAG: hypothetical protein J6D46_06940 [Lachnospiraceae bacterium]|nr:hypothetical protein [Lachnospiraceae bacterium]